MGQNVHILVNVLNKLSNIITEREIRKEGFETNYDDVPVTLEDGTTAHRRGEPTEYFMERKEAKFVELSESLKKEKEIIRLQKEYAKATVDLELADDRVDVIYKKLKDALNNQNQRQD